MKSSHRYNINRYINNGTQSLAKTRDCMQGHPLKTIILNVLRLSPLLFVLGCNPPSYDPSYYPLCEIEYSPLISSIAPDLLSVVNAIDAESADPIRVETIGSGTQVLVESIITGTDYEINGSDPDIIIEDREGQWLASNQDVPTGYHPFHTRYRLPKATQRLLIHERWAATFPHYVPPAEVSRFSTYGHAYPSVRYGRGTEMLELLAEAINLQQPEIAYFLGDMVRYGDYSEYDKLDNFLFAQLFQSDGETPLDYEYVPGNHELRQVPEKAQHFFERAGLPTPVVELANVNLISFVSSLDTLTLAKLSISDAFASISGTTKPSLLLSHHHIWQNFRHCAYSSTPYFSGDQILPFMNGGTSSYGFVKGIIGGDYNNAFFKEDIGNGMTGYKVGSNSSSEPQNFTIFSVDSFGNVYHNTIYLDI